VAGFTQAFSKCLYVVGVRLGRAGVKKSDHRQRRLLRACGERPSHRAAKQRDELTALHV
jgi:hypothetical protein